uniref:Retrovirus-related Pol polyprotein from transposon TNT 1-94 n=1 Tax=Tanacetum cinerariifolium TaxID=118510 RepID=A0A6L2MVF1_TANCI|nr:retrovirus-related Pol polyprotein from transposon TNT 1-94 [Tanacetum cinerariifolium]
MKEETRERNDGSKVSKERKKRKNIRLMNYGKMKPTNQHLLQAMERVVAAAKLPLLNPNEFDLWKIRIEQYFLMIDYSLSEVILNGDSPTSTRIVDGVVQVIAPTTAEQRLARKNKLKARGTLLMVVLDKHQLKFKIHKDAKSLMEAIEKRFGVSAVPSVSAASSKALISTLPNVDCLSDAITKDSIPQCLWYITRSLILSFFEITQSDNNLRRSYINSFQQVHFLKSKDEAPEVIKTFMKKTQILLQDPVIIVRTDNDTKFKNQVLKEYFSSIGISHQSSSMRTPQQNGFVERRNQMLVEVARTMLIFSCASLFLWAKAISTTSYTQYRSIIHCQFDKTPYEHINGRKLDISFLHVFGALCYPKNDHEEIEKLGAKGDIAFFIGYSTNSYAYRVYNRMTKKIIKTMNVTFDELSDMDFEQRNQNPGFKA